MPAPQTYADLQASILRWMDDADLSVEIPELIGLSEVRLSRRLESPEMEASTLLPLSNGVAAIPTNMLQLRSVYILSSSGKRLPLEAVTEEDFNQRSGTWTGTPARYVVQGLTFVVQPTNDAYSLYITYKQTLPALSDANPTNWLLTKYPDLYLAHTLALAELYGWNDSRAAGLSTVADNTIDEINQAGRKLRYGAGPLTPRAPVGDFGVCGTAYRRGGYYEPPLTDDNGSELWDG